MSLVGGVTLPYLYRNPEQRSIFRHRAKRKSARIRPRYALVTYIRMLDEGNANCITGQPNSQETAAISVNNNTNCEPSRFIPGSRTGTYDTVKLTTPLFGVNDIKEPDDWQIGRGTTWSEVASGQVPALSKRLYIDYKGEETEPGKHVTTVGFDYNPSKGLAVTVPSAPSLLYGNALLPLTPDDVRPWMDATRQVVDRHIHANLDTFHVSRLDSSTIWDVDEPVAAYIGLFNAMTGAKQRRTDKKYYENETIQFANKSQAIGFYDKYAKEEHAGLLGVDSNTNLLRFEVQKKIRSSVKSAYGGLVFLDLGTDEIIRKTVEHRMKAFNMFFPFDESRPEIKDFTNRFNSFQAMKVDGQRNHVNNFCKALMLREGVLTIEQLDLLMRLEGYSPQYINRHNRQLREIEAMWIDSKDLYGEVMELIRNDIKAVA